MKKHIINFFRLFLPIILGGITGFLIKDFIDFNSIIKPPLAPPSWLFPIAWSILYLLIGLAYYLYKKEFEEFSEIEIIYFLQLFFNYAWTIIFFILKWRFFSIIWIFILIGLNILLTIKFLQKKKISGYLLTPYLLWLCFATYLNIGIYLLN